MIVISVYSPRFPPWPRWSWLLFCNMTVLHYIFTRVNNIASVGAPEMILSHSTATLHLPLTVILYWHTCSCVSACILDILDIIYLSLFPSIACHNLDISRYLSFTFARLQKQYYWFLGCNCSFDKVLERLNIISNVHEGWRWKMYFLFQHLNIMYYADIYSKAVVMYTR